MNLKPKHLTKGISMETIRVWKSGSGISLQKHTEYSPWVALTFWLNDNLIVYIKLLTISRLKDNTGDKKLLMQVSKKQKANFDGENIILMVFFHLWNESLLFLWSIITKYDLIDCIIFYLILKPLRVAKILHNEVESICEENLYT